MRTISRGVRRHAAVGLTRAKHEQLRELARRSTRARFLFVEMYWHHKFLSVLQHRPRSLIEEHRTAGTLGIHGLTVHQTEMAFKEALWILRVSWGRCLQVARKRVYQNPEMGGPKRRWLFFVMRWPTLPEACLLGETVHVSREWASGLDEGRLSQDLRRLISRSRGRCPRPGKTTWFEVDTNLYRTFTRPEDRHFRGAWLAITGLERGKRICIPLAGKTLDDFRPRTSKRKSLPTLHVEVGERVVFHLRERVACIESAGFLEAGLDKGYSTLLTVSVGDPEAAEAYGAGAAELIGSVAEASSQRRKARQRLMALERSLRNVDAAKARRIRRRNLGRTRFARDSLRDRARLVQQVGKALNQLFAAHPDLNLLHVEHLRFRGGKFSRPMRRRLARWLKGHLQRSLEYKAQLHGVRLNVVNASWTSLTCPRCGYPSRNNRSGERFVCGSCRYTGGADAVAATNILTRGSDREITRYMRKERVEQILMRRWRSAPTGGAWDSNVEQDGRSTSSREQLAVSIARPTFRSQILSASQSPQ
jgi:putative transposase